MISLSPCTYRSSEHTFRAQSAAYLKIVCLSLLITGGLHSIVHGQIKRLEIGDRVRITAPFVDPMERIQGTISEMSGSVLVLSNEDSLIYISDSLIQNLEISTGKKRVVGRGLLIGAVTGAMIFGAISAIRNDACGPVENNCSAAQSNGSAFVSGGTTGLLSGIIAGAVTGFFIKIDTWERAPARLSVGMVPVKTKIDEWAMKPNVSFRIPLSK